MDDALRRLARAAASEPADAKAARDYDRALLRAGLGDEVTRRFQVKFRCPLRYDALTATRDPRVRDCARCGRAVHLVETPFELAEHVAAGRCVAIPLERGRAAYDALALDPRVHAAQEPARPCVVDSAWPLVDIEGVDLQREAFNRLGEDEARRLRALPWLMARSGDVLAVYVAIAGPLDDELRTALTKTFPGLEVRLALCQPDALERSLDRAYGAAQEGYLMGMLA